MYCGSICTRAWGNRGKTVLIEEYPTKGFRILTANPGYHSQRQKPGDSIQMYRTNRYLKAVCVFALFMGTLSISLQATAKQTWSLGIVGNHPAEMTQRFSELLHYMEGQGLPAGRVITVSTIEEMVQKFKSGEVDFMFESAYGALRIMDLTGATPILIREKKGVREYNSVIFVREDSPIESLHDLVGKVVVFEDPNSTSSYLLPLNLLKQAGIKVQQSDTPVPGAVAYYFSGDDSNSIFQVKKGKKAVAGGIKKNAISGKRGFRTLRPESASVPRHVVLVNPRADRKALGSVLLAMKDDPAAQPSLKSSKTPSGFSTFDGDPAAVMENLRRSLGL